MLEDFNKILYGIIIVCSLVFLLCIYKIAQWFRKENIKQRIKELQQQREAHGLYALYRKIGRWRIIIFCFFSSVTIIAVFSVKSYGRENLSVVVLFLGLIICFIANNLFVTRKWRCPLCNGALPCKVGRSSLRPKLIDTCPHCNRTWFADNTETPL